MNKVAISYSNEKYRGSQKAFHRTAEKHGSDMVISFGPEHIDKDFYKKNVHILCQWRGNGYWLWKPYFIIETLKRLNDGDIVLYSDAAVMVQKDLTTLYDIAYDKGIVLFEQANKEHTNRVWTKRDTFEIMGLDEPIYHNGVQLTATFSLWKKEERSFDLLYEWLKYMEDYRVSTDSPNYSMAGNLSDFKDHRHDQSVISLLSQKYNMERFRDPSQWGNEDHKENSPYEQLVWHHRMRFF
jgi:hypothetical protein